MNYMKALKTFTASVVLACSAGSVSAGSNSNYLFLRSNTEADSMTLAFTGKPPFRNRHVLNAKRRAHAEQLNKANTERTEMSALEIKDKDKQVRKSTRKRYGHPFHRR